jgi:hypothetical protein
MAFDFVYTCEKKILPFKQIHYILLTTQGFQTPYNSFLRLCRHHCFLMRNLDANILHPRGTLETPKIRLHRCYATLASGKCNALSSLKYGLHLWYDYQMIGNIYITNYDLVLFDIS